MLNQIHIRDVATIEELHLQLHHGTTMITGETGSGKSIFIEAIELALGGRASSNMVRNNKEKADISLCFDVTHFPKVISSLKEVDLYQDNAECIIRRVVTNDGRSRCYVNGSPVTLQYVKELGELLFHLHGQHEQQVLLKAETQRDMLDRFADHLPLFLAVKNAAEECKALEAEIQLLKEKTLERAKRCDYLRFQLDELLALKLTSSLWETLSKEHHRLTHAEELTHTLQQVSQQLSDDNREAILPALNTLRKTLETILTVEPKANEWLITIHSALIQLTDLESDIQNYLEKIELDPEKLQKIEEKVSQIYNLSRKHKVAPEDLLTFQERLTTELAMLNSSDELIETLLEKQKKLAAQYHEYAHQLTQSREFSAKKLAQQMTETIRILSLPHGEFHIELEKESVPMTSHGNEKIIFQIKTNPDQPLQSLKLISGGELSRLSLAIHLALAHRTAIPTLIFDEVDTGLSGATAEKIGKLLRKLGESYQVFCVTHQAQVAANGHHHLLVEKYFIDNSTHTHLRMLNTDEKTKEVARMLGGEKITEKTLEHAKEVLQGI